MGPRRTRGWDIEIKITEDEKGHYIQYRARPRDDYLSTCLEAVLEVREEDWHRASVRDLIDHMRSRLPKEVNMRTDGEPAVKATMVKVLRTGKVVFYMVLSPI
tara:strand:+ start:143 stop:451 length:309 start_codon:yes stop_codon:yes gene_type:complete